MVAANRSATYIRELDVFSKKIGFNRGLFLYEVASENELRWSLDKFFLDQEAHLASESVVVRRSRRDRRKGA